LPFLKAE